MPNSRSRFARFVVSAAVAGLFAAFAHAGDSLDLFSPQDQSRIVAAAKVHIVELKDGSMWDITLYYRAVELSGRLEDITRIENRRREKPQAKPNKANPELEEAENLGLTRNVMVTLVDPPPLAASADDKDARSIESIEGVAERFHTVIDSPRPVFRSIRVVQSLSKTEAIIKVLDGDEFGDRLIRLTGITQDVVDQDVLVNVFAKKDSEPYVYTATSGARSTIASYHVIERPEDRRTVKSRQVEPEELADAIIRGEAFLREWSAKRTPVASKMGRGARVQWLAKDVTPKPDPSRASKGTPDAQSPDPTH